MIKVAIVEDKRDIREGWQLILEAAFVQVHGNDLTRNASSDQYGIGFRYQLPITNAELIRLDGMMGFFDDNHDVNGIRLEYRHKW